MFFIDISDLDLYNVIKALWNSAYPNPIYRFSGTVPPGEPDNNEIDNTLRRFNGYIDYIAGRPLKVDFNNLKQIDPRLYNRDAGDGAFQKVISKLRNN